MAYTVISAGGLNFAVFSDTNPVLGPVFTSTPVETGNSGEFYTYTAAATDPNDQELTYSLVSPPDGMTINQWTGKISWVPDDDDIGANSITVRVTDEDSLTADQTFTLTIGAFTGTDIDQDWLDAEGPAPYYLDTHYETYRLQVDVTTDGTAFAIIAENVTLNLNGHTITYGDMTPITIANHSFEDGTGGAADNWDFTNAPHGTRNEGVFLENTVYDGDYAIKFTGWTGDEYIESTGTVTLPANTPIALTWMGLNNQYNKTTGCYCYCHLISQDAGGTDRESNYTSTSYRGIQLNVLAFKTGETEETYKIRVGAVNPSGTSYTPYIDDIKLVRNRAYGVALPSYTNTTYFPDCSRFNAAYWAIICNGTITHGANMPYGGHGITTFERRGMTTIYDVDITVNGADAGCVRRIISGWYCVENCILTSNSITVSYRDDKLGAIIKAQAYEYDDIICNNVLSNGPQNGIVLSHGIVAGNTISLKGRYSNNFAIEANSGSSVHDNTITSGTGEYGCRGIQVNGNSSGVTTLVYNNTVTVQEQRNNQEYGTYVPNAYGWQVNGTYGIQIEQGYDAEVYNNNITAIADVSPAVALRITSQNTDERTNVYVHDNTFTAIRTGSGEMILASCISSSAVAPPGGLTIEDNTFITNSVYWRAESPSEYTISRNTWQLTGDTTGFTAFILNSGVDLTCVDNAYYDAASETAWTDALAAVADKLTMQTT